MTYIVIVGEEEKGGHIHGHRTQLEGSLHMLSTFVIISIK